MEIPPFNSKSKFLWTDLPKIFVPPSKLKGVVTEAKKSDRNIVPVIGDE